jgi:hypothetical protein
VTRTGDGRCLARTDAVNPVFIIENLEYHEVVTEVTPPPAQ